MTNVAAAQTPAPAKVATTLLTESLTSVTRIMRLAPGSEIPEHYHPAYDETFVVYQGAITVSLNSEERPLAAGDVVHIPAGTVVVGHNRGTQEAVVVVVFSGNGLGGPLTVPGHPSR